MKQRSLYTCCSLLSFFLIGSSVFANTIDLEVSATSRFTDNARRTNIDPISERQDTYGLNLVGDYSNSLLALDANYRATENRFDKESQPDRSMVEGNANLLIGKEHHPADLLLSHSRRSLLGTPDQVSLLQNEDEREIFSAVPTLRLRLGSVDDFLVRGDVSTIDYRYASEFNSERKGGSLIWQHQFSEISNTEVSVQHTEISYDVLPQSDYEYQRAAISYSTQLRQLSYLISIGYNTAKPELGEEFSAPSYMLEMDYNSGFNTISLYLNQQITDTSLGNGNRGELGNINLGEAGGVGVDQFESRVAELRWRNQGLCGRCSVYASLLYQEDDYQTLNEDTSQNAVTAGIDYRIFRASTLGVRVLSSEREFEEDVARTAFRETSASIEYRHTFINDIGLSVFASVLKSDSDAEALEYEENVYGASLSYTF